MTVVLPNTELSEHFSWEEAFHTSHRDIDNEPSPAEAFTILQNIGRTSIKLEKVRNLLARPITVSSWYRNSQLNIAVGGAPKSDHLTGCAVDFIAPKFGSPLQICKAIVTNKELIGFKQLILEHSWVHISWDAIPGRTNKLEVLSLLANGGYAIGLTDKYGKTYA